MTRWSSPRPYVLTLLLLAPAAGCASNGTTTDAFELTGLVTQARGGAAIAGARVTFRSDTLLVTETTTDASGIYEMLVITDVLFGQVRAEKAGFRPNEATVFFDGPQRRVDLRLLATP